MPTRYHLHNQNQYQGLFTVPISIRLWGPIHHHHHHQGPLRIKAKTSTIFRSSSVSQLAPSQFHHRGQISIGITIEAQSLTRCKSVSAFCYQSPFSTSIIFKAHSASKLKPALLSGAIQCYKLAVSVTIRTCSITVTDI